jgi:hypothetical protein
MLLEKGTMVIHGLHNIFIFISTLFCAKICQNVKDKNKKGIFCHNLLFPKKKNKKKTGFVFFCGPYLDSNFYLVAIFKILLL